MHWACVTGSSSSPTNNAETSETVDVEADVTADELMRVAVIRLACSFHDLPAHRQREVLCHELVHIALSPIDSLIEHVCGALKSKEARDLTRSAYETANEQVAWSIARVLVLTGNQ